MGISIMKLNKSVKKHLSISFVSQAYSSLIILFVYHVNTYFDGSFDGLIVGEGKRETGGRRGGGGGGGGGGGA